MQGIEAEATILLLNSSESIVMTVNNLKQNGSVNLVFPDIPVVEVPDHSYPYFVLLVAVGKVT